MARLPVPGSDDGTWGDVLNDYLAVAHTTSGGLKSDAVSSNAIQDDSITEGKLLSGTGSNGQVLTKNSGTSGGFEWTSATGSPDATPSTKGIVQLAGDLGGTAAAPTVPSLANKANTSTTISAGTGLTGGGDLSANRTLTVTYGTSAGTAAQGNDSRIVGAVQSTLVDAKGDLLVASAADTITRLPVGADGQVLTADAAQASGTKWAPPAASSQAVYPMSAYGFVAATDDLAVHSSQSSFGPNVVRIFIPAGKIISAVGTLVRNAGTLGAGGLNGFAIYDDAGVLVESTPTDDTLWSATGWRIRDLTAPIAAQSSDRFVRVHSVINGYTSPPNIFYAYFGGASADGFNGGYNVPNHRRSVYTGDFSSWPASFNPVSYGTPYEYLPLIVLG